MAHSENGQIFAQYLASLDSHEILSRAKHFPPKRHIPDINAIETETHSAGYISTLKPFCTGNICDPTLCECAKLHAQIGIFARSDEKVLAQNPECSDLYSLILKNLCITTTLSEEQRAKKS